MIQIIQLHLGLFRYLKTELKKKRTHEEYKTFWYGVRSGYLTALKQLVKSYTLIFNKEYRKQKKEYTKQQQIKVDLQRALKMLHYIDKKMATQGKSRRERRSFWREFYKEAQVRTEVFKDLEQELK
jgi:hypothetical protein